MSNMAVLSAKSMNQLKTLSGQDKRMVANLIDNLAQNPRKRRKIFFKGMLSEFLSSLQPSNGLSDDEMDTLISSIKAERNASKTGH